MRRRRGMEARSLQEGAILEPLPRKLHLPQADFTILFVFILFHQAAKAGSSSKLPLLKALDGPQGVKAKLL